MNTYDVAELAQTLFEEAGDALFLFDPESEQIVDANPMSQRLTGHSRQQLRRHAITYLFRSETQGGLARLRNAFRKTGLFHSQEGFFLRQNEEGRWLPVNLTVTRLHTEADTLGLITARDVHEQREAQLLLKNKEAELRRVLTSVSDCLWSANIDARGHWHLSFCSPVIERITGRPADYFRARHECWHAIIHPEDLERVRHMESQLTPESSHEEDYRIVRPDGVVRWVREALEAHAGPNNILRVDGILSDITDRKLAQEALRYSKRLLHEQFVQLQSFFNNTPIALGLLDAQLRYVIVNERLAELNGHSIEEHLGQSIREIIQPDVLAFVEPALRAVLETGQPMINREYRAPLPRDPTDVRDWLVNYYPNLAADGSCTGVYAVLIDNTERKQVEDRLRQSEERFQAFMNHSPTVAFIKDSEGRYVYVNETYERAFEAPSRDFLGKNDFELWPDEVARALRAHDRKVFDSQRASEHVEMVPTPDGAARDWWVLKFPFRDSQDRYFLGGIAFDLTERRKAEQALRRSEERYRLLFERNLAGVFRTNLDGQLLDCNDSFVRILGYDSRADILAHSAREFYIDPADRRALLDHLHRNPLLTNFEVRMRRKNGSSIWILENVSLIDGSGGQAFLEGTIVDIHQQKLTLEALRASETKYRCLIENLEQSIFLKDPELRFVAVNRHFCEAIGRSEGEILGKTDLDFYPRALAEKYRADDMLVLSEGRILQAEEQNLQHGQLRTVRVIKTPVKDDEGRVNGVLGIFWDITDQLSLEAQLRQAQKMEAIGQLAGGIAHDFNNLLTVILGNLSYVLGQQQPALETSLELLQSAEQASLRAAELTQRLLGFSRRTMLHSEPLNVNQAIDETVRFLRRTIDPRIEVTTVTAGDLWLVKADPGMINQVLMNLALNARDAMPHGGALLLETSRFEPDDDYLRLHLDSRPGEFVRLRVRDTGAGMAPEVRQRIFEPFFTTKDVGKGTGLGLAMVFGIVKQHHGWIVCASAPGRGTTFDIFLPRYQGTSSAAPPASRAAVPAGHETILLVDDETMIRNLGVMTLQRLGYQILQAENGLEALDIYQKKHGSIDLVLLDGTMPHLSGRDTLRELIRIHPGVRVLFSSGYSTDHHDLSNFPQIVGFIQKPYRVEELASKVRAILDQATD